MGNRKVKPSLMRDTRAETETYTLLDENAKWPQQSATMAEATTAECHWANVNDLMGRSLGLFWELHFNPTLVFVLLADSACAFLSFWASVGKWGSLICHRHAQHTQSLPPWPCWPADLLSEGLRLDTPAAWVHSGDFPPFWCKGPQSYCQGFRTAGCC